MGTGQKFGFIIIRQGNLNQLLLSCCLLRYKVGMMTHVHEGRSMGAACRVPAAESVGAQLVELISLDSTLLPKA